MITRIPTTTTTKILASATPTCSHKSKSRAMQQKHTNNVIITTTQQQLPAGQLNATNKRVVIMKTTTIRRLSLSIMQILLLACALPPPLQPLLPTLLPPQRSLAVEALPITSKPIESTAENLAWQAWLKLPAEQKLLEKSRKVTPKSIFSLPFRECPPGHQLFQSRCIPTVNINQSDLLTQQVLGLFLGSAQDGSGGAGGTGNADNAYEFDYGEEDYGLGMGEGASVVMYDSPQPFNGGADSGASEGALNTQQQAPHMRDEPLKFNLFAQKYPTSDYESDVSSGSGGVEGSGSAAEGTRMQAGAESTTQLFNSTQFLDAVQGFMQSHVTANETMTMPDVNTNTTATASTSTTTATEHNSTTHEHPANNQQQQHSHQGLDDLHAASSNISAFAVGEIDAIILPAVSTGGTATTQADAGVGVEAEGAIVTSRDDLESQSIALFKDNSSVQLQVTTVIAQTDKINRTEDEDGVHKTDEMEDLVAAAAQQQPQQSSLAQFLRADALLPLASVTPYLTMTTAIPSASVTTTRSEEHAPETTTLPTALTKDERPRSVMAQSDTDAQETSFVTSTEAESTTHFQIDETTVVEVNEEEEELAKVARADTSLLEAISQQQQLESAKSKVEQAVDDSEEAATTTTSEIAINAETTTIKTNGNILTEPTINLDKTAEDSTTAEGETTIVPAHFEVNDAVPTDETTTSHQPLIVTTVTEPSTIITTTTTTAKVILSTTQSTDRFHSAPAAVAAAVAPNHLLANKQVSAAVSPAAVILATTVRTADNTSGRKAAASSAAGGLSEFALNDMPGSGINDLVNVDGSYNNNQNKSNKKSPIRIVVRKSVLAAGPKTSEINIEQELRMINELVKGNRQFAALKMPAIKTTTQIAETTNEKLSTAAQEKLDAKKSANTAVNVSDGEAEVVEAEVRRVISELKTTTEEIATTLKTTKELTTPQVATTTPIDTSELKSILPVSSSVEASATTIKSQASAKMESGNDELATTVENSKVAETASKIIELATKTSGEPESDFETETAAKLNTEATDATIWSRIMPMFGFGGEAVVENDELVGVVATTTTAQDLTKSTSSLDGSTSSSSSSSSSINSSSKSSISDIRSISANDNIGIKLNNNNNNNNNTDSHIRRNSKIIQIDHLSDNSVAADVAAAATTTNTLEEAQATGTTITTTNTATTIAAHDHDTNTKEMNAEEPSSYWWLPAGWRLDRGISEEQPLLYRLWSAFPESQLKTKVKT